MGAKNCHTARAQQQEQLDEFRAQITTWYLDERLTALDVQERLKARGFDLTVGQVHYAFHRYGLKRDRNSRSEKLLTALKNKKYTVKTCEHCSNTFQPKSSMQMFCSTCSPNRTWWKRIKIYGINKPQFDLMMQNQENKCGICSTTIGDDAAVDHDHVTRQIRGLLCKPCNLKLVVVEDDSFVNRAKTYLECSVTAGYDKVKVT